MVMVVPDGLILVSVPAFTSLIVTPSYFTADPSLLAAKLETESKKQSVAAASRVLIFGSPKRLRVLSSVDL
jgi:hypothetical protein